MKILHSADWHIGQFKGPVVNGVNLRSMDTVRCLENMVEIAKEERPDVVCISGDIFHQEQIGPVRYSDEMVTATRIIEELAAAAQCVIVMRGTPNHDGAGQFRVLKKMLSHNKKVLVATEPQVFALPCANIACIPGFDKQEFRAKFPGLSADEENIVWTENISNIVMGLRAQCFGDVPAVLMAHYTVPGCNMESGQTSFFANFEPVIPREALDAAGFDLVALGHIHRPQKFPGKDWYYSGAINAMNFNDEGQERGFWIHKAHPSGVWQSIFHDTPYRKFETITWDREDVAAYLRGGKMYLIEQNLGEKVTDKIVRIRYSCTTDQKKALNIPVLQSDLYDVGAFYVADIEAESMVDITNRGLLSEESDPLPNLRKWLDEKCYKDSDKIVEMAEPIISAAMAQSITSEIHGIFRPISISVKNYRNYKEESFDFTDISFCTINGVNGAGKSSLFMDAIVDCLFEETREGDGKAWIRGSEDARSGSIEFIFEIGAKRFRVVRTRMKSGRATLNLSQMDEGGAEWINLSGERAKDTQNEIQKILGMDSLTFRSCALIMQDQYGLFLQARKDERIAILGNLLGLGVYAIMETEARKRLKDSRQQLMSKKEAVKIKNEFVADKGNPDQELKDVDYEIRSCTADKELIETERDAVKDQLAAYQEAKKELKELTQARLERLDERNELAEAILSTQSIIDECDSILKDADHIREAAKEYAEVEKDVQRLAKEQVRFESEKKALAEHNQQMMRHQNTMEAAAFRNEQIADELRRLQAAGAEDIDQKIAELEKARKSLDEIREKKDRSAAIVQESSAKREEIIEAINKISTQKKLAEADLEGFLKQKEFMENSGCPDPDKASCRFLEKAKEDVSRIDKTRECISILGTSIEESKKAYEEYADAKRKELAEIGYDREEEERILNNIGALEKYQKIKAQREEEKLQIARLEAEKDSNDKIIASYTENASQLKLRALELTESVSLLSESVKEYEHAKQNAEKLKPYMEKERMLPVFEERRRNASEKLAEIDEKVKKNAEVYDDLAGKWADAEKRLREYPDDMEAKLPAMESRLKENAEKMQSLQVKKGILLQRAEDVREMLREIDVLNKGIVEEAATADRYDILKQAFSQDGVPHQIIRNIIPHITDTANNILGAMTGGSMGVEFVMEKAVKGKDGDKATLDVLINEYGKTTLPYASKSGGEKVKASLAVILALAEIKTSAAGIQLGMLFIDEPPFLDEDGTQAYVDSLETIRRRYPDVKIMAITHDEAMKARFTQSVMVIKTAEGSKVIY